MEIRIRSVKSIDDNPKGIGFVYSCGFRDHKIPIYIDWDLEGVFLLLINGEGLSELKTPDRHQILVEDVVLASSFGRGAYNCFRAHTADEPLWLEGWITNPQVFNVTEKQHYGGGGGERYGHSERGYTFHILGYLVRRWWTECRGSGYSCSYPHHEGLEVTKLPDSSKPAGHVYLSEQEQNSTLQHKSPLN